MGRKMAEYANRYGLGFSQTVVYLLGALAPMVWVGVPLGWAKKPKLLACLESWRSPLLWWLPRPFEFRWWDPTRQRPLRFQGLLPLQSSCSRHAIIRTPIAVAVGTMGLTGLYLQLPKRGPNENDGFPR